jgi:surface protein
MYQMLCNATSFNQDISSWDVSNVTDMDQMFDGANALSDENKCAIHLSFSSNDAWPYDWSEYCGQVSIDDETLPITFKLHNAYPNPFNPTTTIKYDLPEDAMVSITIYDVMGRRVKSLVNRDQTAGYRSANWDATNNVGEPVSAGMYIYTIQAGEYRKTKKMVLLK